LIKFSYAEVDIIDVHFLPFGLVLVTDDGFEILDTNLEIQGNFEANDYLARSSGHVTPLTIFQIRDMFLLCFDGRLFINFDCRTMT